MALAEEHKNKVIEELGTVESILRDVFDGSCFVGHRNYLLGQNSASQLVCEFLVEKEPGTGPTKAYPIVIPYVSPPNKE